MACSNLFCYSTRIPSVNFNIAIGSPIISIHVENFNFDSIFVAADIIGPYLKRQLHPFAYIFSDPAIFQHVSNKWIALPSNLLRTNNFPNDKFLIEYSQLYLQKN